MHGYVGNLGVLPAVEGGTGYSVQVQLLPYLEQMSLYNSINQDVIVGFGGENNTADLTQQSVYLCPSDTPPVVHTFYLQPRGSLASSSYACNVGYWPQRFGYNGAFPPRYGLLQLHSRVIPEEGPWGFGGFVDGTATTALCAEWTLGDMDLSRRSENREVFRTPSATAEPGDLETFVANCRGILIQDALPFNTLRKGSHWLEGGPVSTAYNHTLSVNERSCTNGPSSIGVEGGCTAGSVHVGGAHVVFADGHTGYVKSTISLATWRALGSRNGGEVPASDADR